MMLSRIWYVAQGLLVLVGSSSLRADEWSTIMAKASAGLLGAYAVHHLLQPVSPAMDLDNLNAVTFIPAHYMPDTVQDSVSIRTLCSQIEKHIPCYALPVNNTSFIANNGVVAVPQAQTIVIVCHGTGRVHFSAPTTMGVLIAYRYMRLGYIPADAVCVTYTSPNSTLKYLNFAQANDQECLATMVAATVQANPQAHIVILSVCNGAATALNYLATYNDPRDYKQRIKAVLLESPYISALRTAEHIGAVWFPWPLSKIPAVALQCLPTQHVAQAPTILDAIVGIPKHIAMLICALPHDHLTPYKDSQKIACTALENGYKALFCTFPDLDSHGNRTVSHAHLARETGFLWLYHAFLASCGLEHTPDLARKGEDVFIKAILETHKLAL